MSCISKNNNTLTENVEDLDIVMAMHNLSENSGNYFMTSGSLWNYYIDEEMMMRIKIRMLVIIE